MSALRRSEDLLSLKTRRIVIQNEDSSYPPAGAVLAMDSKGRGGTVITQDVSLNSVALLGQTTAGILTYSDVSGLLLNSEPISGLPAPVPFDSVPDSANLSDLIESYNELLAVLNGTLITVNPPPVVTGLVATPGVNTADLSWNSVGSGYTVDLCGSTVASDVSGTTYQFTSLVPTTTYTASVTVNNNSVFPGLPTSVSFTTSGFPVVTGLTVSSIDVSNASVSWNSVGGGYTYNVYRGATFLANVSETSYLLTGLSPATAYTVSVRVTDGTYQGAPASVSFTTSGLPVVTNLTVSSIDVSAASISWTSVGGGYTYNVYRGAAFLETVSGTTYSLTGLTATTAYTVSVRVTDGTNQGSPASTSFTTATPLTVTASAVTGTGAKISWNSAGSGYSYNLQILQGSAVIETLTGLTDLSYSVTDLSDSTTYIASIRFTSSGFTSSSAYTTTFTTVGPSEFGFLDYTIVPGYYQSTDGGSFPRSTGYVVDNVGSPWIGYQSNTISLRMKSPTSSGVVIHVYDALGNTIANSATISVTTEQVYIIPLTTTITVTYSMLFKFEWTGPAVLDFAVFTTFAAPFTTMSPVLFLTNSNVYIPFNPSFTGGFVCGFSLV